MFQQDGPHNFVHVLKSAGEQSRQILTKSGKERTSIEDISLDGYELSEEHLRIVTGGMEPVGTSSSTAQSDNDY